MARARDSWRDVTQIAEDVYSLCQTDGGFVHAYLFNDGNMLTLVDTLWDSDAAVVFRCLRKLGRAPGDIGHIVVTHAHRSHLGGLAQLKQTTGATVWAHDWEADIIAGKRRAKPVSLTALRPRRIYKFRLGLALGKFPHRPCWVDESLTDNVQVGPLRAIHLPGHTPGHMGFYCEKARVLIAGDAVATWPSLGPGWPAFNLDEAEHRASVMKMAGLHVNAVGVGHGHPITDDAQALLKEVAYR
jgi:glyoxylase-like metal-dependent hydrolase (beta-lactamase superfamily II)